MKTIFLSRSAVEAVFAAAVNQSDYLVGLYKLATPRWDEIQCFNNAWPVCSKATWSSICVMAQEFDRKLNQSRAFDDQSLPGGAWLNTGFSCRGGEDLALWEVLPVPDDKITFKPDHITAGEIATGVQ